MRAFYREKILEDLDKKIVFLSGPRQTGKTHLARSLMDRFANPVYLNYDHADDRHVINSLLWPKKTDFLILDEVHKMPEWKNYIKGVFDTRPPHLKILVTGSARLETFRKGGDSLAGRFFSAHLFPFTIKELKINDMMCDSDRLLERSGFPEPYLTNSDVDARRWRNQYTDSLIRGEVLDLERVAELKAMEHLLALLRERVGSPVSYRNLAEDLSISPNTVKRYTDILEALYVIFRITPFSNRIQRSIIREPKIYFFDWCLPVNEGARLENFAAVSLLKHITARNDFLGERESLHFIRSRDGREVDFCVASDGEAKQMIEVKMSDSSIDKNLLYFESRNSIPAVQIVWNLKNEREERNIAVVKMESFLENLYI